MAFTKITQTQLNSRGATTLDNKPTISATALKTEFDAPAKQVVAPALNNLIDELQATTASGSIGVTVPSGCPTGTAANLQSVLNAVSTMASTSSGEAHTHSNKALLDTYTQTEVNLADAVTKKHAHDNKALLDTYDQTNANITDAVSKKHSHSNKELLDTYTQTETNIADAVNKKHNHDNKTVIDKFGEDSSGNPLYNGNPIGGGSGGSSVEWSQYVLSGSKIAQIDINGTKTDIYAPTSGGGGGATSYSALSDKPSINSVELNGNSTSATLGLASASDITTLNTNKADKATTLAGYGITDGAKSSDLNTKISKPSSPNAGDVLTYKNGSWVAEEPSGGGHEMYTDIDDLPTDDDGNIDIPSTDEHVMSAHLIQRFSNVFTERVVFTITADNTTKGTWQTDEPDDWVIDDEHMLILPEFYEADDEELEFRFMFDSTNGQPIYLGGYQYCSQTTKDGVNCGGLCVKLANSPDEDVRVAIDITHLRIKTVEDGSV